MNFNIDHPEKNEAVEESAPYYALLFPSFITGVGLLVFYIVTRYIHVIPYTAILFLIGTIMGIALSAYERNDHFPEDQLNQSILMWDNINGELLLLAFLPGLLFKDAYTLDVHLFRQAFGQILLMAFPMVLLGTVLTALCAYYILPFGWSFNLCMTFGAILSATDPVAVAALLNELGAPPRLKIHISGESLVNDGSAIVFFTIFKLLYLEDIGLGEESIGFGKGLYKFCMMSVGAALLGILFGGVIVLILWFLNRRFNNEEKIVQITATFCIAYLSYYVGEAVLHLSGVITVLFCGLTTKFFADSLIIDHGMMNKFWNLVEHILNTLLFCLGGVIWGSVIGGSPAREEIFDAYDWGYLVLIYLLIMIIRFFLFGMFFPLISRIGLKSNWKEMVFQSFSGLRGAVGIALAILLDHEVATETVRIDPSRDSTGQVFGLVGKFIVSLKCVC